MTIQLILLLCALLVLGTPGMLLSYLLLPADAVLIERIAIASAFALGAIGILLFYASVAGIPLTPLLVLGISVAGTAITGSLLWRKKV